PGLVTSGDTTPYSGSPSIHWALLLQNRNTRMSHVAVAVGGNHQCRSGRGSRGEGCGRPCLVTQAPDIRSTLHQSPLNVAGCLVAERLQFDARGGAIDVDGGTGRK